MDMGLSGKRALVTGSSSGLGRAIAESLAAEGASVVVHGRDEVRTGAVADGIRARGGDAWAAVGDLATEGGAGAVAAAAGEVDILVNNAGVYDGLAWSDLAPRQWQSIYEVNVVSGVRMIEYLVPGMRQRGWGRIIQIGGGWPCNRPPTNRTTTPRSPHGTTSPCRWPVNSRAPVSPATPSRPAPYSPNRFVR